MICIKPLELRIKIRGHRVLDILVNTVSVIVYKCYNVAAATVLSSSNKYLAMVVMLKKLLSFIKLFC